MLLLGVLMTGCGLFAAREPEAPVGEGGTYVQPDTPEQVIANLQAAVAELNTQNYRRSLAEDLTFEPTAEAEAQYNLWRTWSRTEEESYFSALAGAAEAVEDGHELRLVDDTPVFTEAGRSVLDTNYFLTVQHRRPDAPTEVQGRLIWEIVQGGDGLWRLQRWTDRQLGSGPSWSDLKARFVQ